MFYLVTIRIFLGSICESPKLLRAFYAQTADALTKVKRKVTAIKAGRMVYTYTLVRSVHTLTMGIDVMVIWDLLLCNDCTAHIFRIE